MPPAGYALTNYRIDTRGHIKAIEFCDWDTIEEVYTRFWRWYDLDGNIIESGNTPQIGSYPQVWDLRIDTRGHVAAISYGVAFPLPHWYDLEGNDLGVIDTVVGLYDIRIDTRGHVVAVRTIIEPGLWYDLAGELVA